MSQHYLYSFIFIALGTATLMGCSDASLTPIVPKAAINLEIQGYCPASGFQYVDHFVYNSSAFFNGTQWANDFDRDGLADSFEQNTSNFQVFGTSYLLADTNQNGYSDRVKVAMSLNSAGQSIMPICSNPGVDTDGDGLSDCEEALMGTNPTLPDSALDGIPDGVAVRFGMNPNDVNGAISSISGDGFTNLQKVKMGIPVSTYLSDDSQGLMPGYSSATVTGQPNCYNFSVTNLPIVQVTNGNMLQVIVLENPQLPPTGGTNSVGTQAHSLSVLFPSNISPGSTIVVTGGIKGQAVGQTVGGVTIPLTVVGGTGS